MRKVVLSWSGGKDSMTALKRLNENPELEVIGLMTAFSGADEVVNLHYIPHSLIQKQAEALNLDFFPIYLSEKAPNKEYEQKHQEIFQQLKAEGVYDIAFGDIHLEPIREYRDRLLADNEMNGFYPLWGEKPVDLVREFLEAGYEAIITSIDKLQVPEDLLGQKLSLEIMRDLETKTLDPCGENGEYHTFVYNGPGFQRSLSFETGDSFERDFRPEVNMNLKVNNLQGNSY